MGEGLGIYKLGCGAKSERTYQAAKASGVVAEYNGVGLTVQIDKY